jgi:hypothetical protein
VSVRGAFVRAVGLAALATVALVVAVVLLPVAVELSLRAYAVALGGIALALVVSVAGLGPAFGSAPIRPPRGGPPEAARPDRLWKLENAVDFALTSGFDLHHRLRPLLRQIAAERLARTGVDLDGNPERARAILGSEAWELLRPERPRPPRRSPGTTVAALDRVVGAMERCG